MDGFEGERPSELKDMTAEAVKAKVVKAAEEKAVGVVTRITEAGGQLSDETVKGMGKRIAEVRAQPAEAIKQKAVEEAAQMEQARRIVRSAEKGVGLETPVQHAATVAQVSETQPKAPAPSFRETFTAKGHESGKGPLSTRIGNPMPAAKLK